MSFRLCMLWKLLQNNFKMKLTIKDITLIGMMVAVIEVSKQALAFLPNIELTSFWIILFSLFFGNKIFYVITVFILIEGAIYGINLWWFMYLYIWPLLAILTRVFRKMDSAWSWAIFSGAFGLSFGVLCAIPYIFLSGPKAALAWWGKGIPWDITHCIGNFVIMLVLYHPINRVMKLLK